MMGFFGIASATDFETDVSHLATKLAGIPNAASFRVSGTGHALLLAPASYTTSGGTALTAWLGQQVADDAGWTATGP